MKIIVIKQSRIKQIKMKHLRQSQHQVSCKMSKSLINESKSITESMCPKYRKFTNFPKSGQKENEQIPHLIDVAGQQQNYKTKGNVAVVKTETTNNDDPFDIHNHSLLSLNNNKRRHTIVPPPILLTKLSNINHDNDPQSPHFKIRNRLTSEHSPGLLSRHDNEQKVQQQITSTFNQLNLTISNLSELFQKRMKTHQDELLKMMMQEIKRLNHQSQKTIQTYNELIKLKSADSANDDLTIQLGLYKKHALSLHEENQMLKKEIQYLKKLNNQYELKIRTDQETLRQVTKKLVFYKNKVKSNFKNTVTQSAQNIKEQSSIIDEKQKKEQNLLPSLGNTQNKHKQQQQLLSKGTPLTKANSKSLNYSRRSHQFSIQQSLQSPKIGTTRAKEQQTNIESQQNTLLLKLNNSINQKYNSHQRVDQLSLQFSPKSNHKKSLQIDETLERRVHQMSNQQQPHRSQTVIMNREKVISFLNESRPSIKSIISEKRMFDGKIKNQQFLASRQRNSSNKIIKIKNKVKLSSFDQQQFLALKKSLEMSLVQRQRINNQSQKDS